MSPWTRRSPIAEEFGEKSPTQFSFNQKYCVCACEAEDTALCSAAFLSDVVAHKSFEHTQRRKQTPALNSQAGRRWGRDRQVYTVGASISDIFLDSSPDSLLLTLDVS